MQKLKLSQLVNSVEALKNLTEMKLPIKISYQLAKLVGEVNNELKTYDEKRKEIVAQFATKNEETGELSIDQENKELVEKFYEEYNKLIELEVEIKFANKIKIEDLGSVEIAPKDLIDWLFTIEE